MIQKKLSKSLKLELDLIQRTGLYTTNLKIEGNEKFLDPQKQIIVFRMVQEVLQNIIKHAKARCILVVLKFYPAILP